MCTFTFITVLGFNCYFYCYYSFTSSHRFPHLLRFSTIFINTSINSSTTTNYKGKARHISLSLSPAFSLESRPGESEIGKEREQAVFTSFRRRDTVSHTSIRRTSYYTSSSTFHSSSSTLQTNKKNWTDSSRFSFSRELFLVFSLNSYILFVPLTLSSVYITEEKIAVWAKLFALE